MWRKHYSLGNWNHYVKDHLVSLIIDNGSHKNIESRKLVLDLLLPTTTHPTPYHLRWIKDAGNITLIARQCAITFSIWSFRDTIHCDVTPLDSFELIVGCRTSIIDIPFMMGSTTSTKFRKMVKYTNSPMLLLCLDLLYFLASTEWNRLMSMST